MKYVAQLFTPPQAECWGVAQWAIYIVLLSLGFWGLRWFADMCGGAVRVYLRGH